MRRARRAIVQKYVHPVLFSLFDLIFIAFTQSILIFMFSAAPAYIVLLTSKFEPEITTADLAFFAVQFTLVISEFVSDGQQWGMPRSTLQSPPPPNDTMADMRCSIPNSQAQLLG